jgi:hypothetical protein
MSMTGPEANGKEKSKLKNNIYQLKWKNGANKDEA